MPSRDGIDDHVERVAIERALTRRKPNVEAFARRFGLSRDALYRHRRKMIQRAPERFRRMAAEDWSTTPRSWSGCAPRRAAAGSRASGPTTPS